MIPLIYKDLCPNCNGDISSLRLHRGLPCSKCISRPVPPEEVCRYLKEGNLARICEIKEEIGKFSGFFETVTGHTPNNLQLNWTRKFFLGNSFAMIAPTGIGKTTFGLVMAKFLAQREEKTYLLFPTQLLVDQAYERLRELGHDEGLLAYSRNLFKKKELEEIKQKIGSGDFSTLITTTMFLYRNLDLIPGGSFRFIFVDDIDSVLKSGRNIDKLLRLLNFSEKDIQSAMKLIALKRKLAGGEQSRSLLKQYETLQKRMEFIKRKRRGILAVSSATSNPGSSRVNLFRELLDFEVGRVNITLRNIEDIYEEVKSEELYPRSLELIRQLGSGGLVLVPAVGGKEEVDRYYNFLKENGLNPIHYEEYEERLEEYRSGRAEVIVAIGSNRNPVARGLDMPETIRYALFLDVPRMEIRINLSESPLQLFYLIMALSSFLSKHPLLPDTTVEKLRQYAEILRNREKLSESRMSEITSFLKEEVLTPSLISGLKESDEITVAEKGGELYFVIPDVTGYIQASGRTSRLYAGGLSKGLAYTLVVDKKAFRSLIKKIKWNYEEIQFKKAEEVDLEKIIREIDYHRERIRNPDKITEEAKKDFFKTTMIIVESPNKARTIANFFGKALRRSRHGINGYEIAIGERYLLIIASKGHICDLNKTQGLYGVLKDDQFIPVFEPIDDNRYEIIKALRNFSLEVDEVYIATDPDTEGEKIGFDLTLNIKPYNMNIKRSEFHEVTRKAFLDAINNAREIDLDLVKAQIVRRVYDRWIGFKISQFIQKQLSKNTLSAGRVQTPVLEWIVKRNEESKKKIWVLEVKFDSHKVEFEFKDQKSLERYLDADRIIVKKTGEEVISQFVKPFTTDTLLVEAARELKLSPTRIMNLAQELFEGGFITYHRTDSIRVSSTGISIAREYIEEKFSPELFKPRSFSSAGGAHECIRPTRALDPEELRFFLMNRQQKLSDDHMRLYELIFKRFIASQMREVKLKRETFAVMLKDLTRELSLNTEILEEGYNLVLPVPTEKLPEGEFAVEQVTTSTRPAAQNYTFATIVREMKEKGIGRPSTYAITIQKLLDRRYIVNKNGYLFATPLGRKVLKTIKERNEYYRFVEERFTRQLEELMDMIEERRFDYQEALEQLYNQLITTD